MGVLPSMSADTDIMAVSQRSRLSHTRITIFIAGNIIIIIGVLGGLTEILFGGFLSLLSGKRSTSLGYVIPALFYILVGTLALISASSCMRKWNCNRLFYGLTLHFSIVAIIIAIVFRLIYADTYDKTKLVKSEKRTEMSLTRFNAIFFQGMYFTYESNVPFFFSSVMAIFELIGVLLLIILALVSFSEVCRRNL